MLGYIRPVYMVPGLCNYVDYHVYSHSKYKLLRLRYVITVVFLKTS